MEKIKYSKIKKEISSIVSNNEFSKVFKLKTGEYLKILTPYSLSINNLPGLNFEKKLLDSDKYILTSSINKPNAIIMSDEGMCVGYKVSPVYGKSLNDSVDRTDYKALTDLEFYRDIHKKIESIIKKESNIIVTDLCTCDNIIVKNRNDISLIDYDGMQIGPHPTFQISTTIGSDEQYVNNKKYYNNGLFNKNLDKKSLIYLYFLHTFNVKLSSIGINYPNSSEKISIDNIFEYMGFKDYNLYDKISKIFNDKVDNVYLNDDIDRITRDYKMYLVPAPTEVGYMKRLIKK